MKCIFFDKRDLSLVSRTAITPKFKMRWFPNEGRYWAGKLQTEINLVPLMPDEDETVRGSVVLDLRIWWRHVHTLLVHQRSTPTWRFHTGLSMISVEHFDKYLQFGNKHKPKTWRSVFSIYFLQDHNFLTLSTQWLSIYFFIAWQWKQSINKYALLTKCQVKMAG